VTEKITYINERGESLEFSPHSSYHTNIRDCTGLPDIYNTIASTGSMGQDGETFVASRIEGRDIEIFGHIKDRDKIRKHLRRRDLNRILNPQYSAALVYEFGPFRRVIACKVDKGPIINRKGIFERFTIQLSCLNPFWRDGHETRNNIAAWMGAFEFPDIDGGLELNDDEGWEIEYREPSLIVNVFNGGDVETGLRAEFKALGQLENPSILNVHTMEFIKLNISMVAGDILSLNTGYGEKNVTLTRNGTTTTAFRHLDIDSTYMQLVPGDNLFRYDAETNLDNLEVSIYHNNQYLGV